MSSSGDEITALRSRENDLAEALLPPVEDVTEGLEPRDRFLVHAYLVLACAMIEEFVEARFRDHVAEATAVEPDGYSRCFVTLATKFSDDVIGQNSGKVPVASEAVPTLRGLYESKVLTANNGIRRRNFQTLAKPVGLHPDVEDQCEELLAAADALGSKRGAVAHLGTVSEEIRPDEARKLVEDVLKEMDSLVAVLR
jgi:RiboL-PSP-HEPN